MPHQLARKLAFGPSALNDLERAFDSAWLELCAWGIDANTEEQIKRIRTNLAQRIMEYATEGEDDVVHLKEWLTRVASPMRSWSSAAESGHDVASLSSAAGRYGVRLQFRSHVEDDLVHQSLTIERG